MITPPCLVPEVLFVDIPVLAEHAWTKETMLSKAVTASHGFLALRILHVAGV